MKADYTKLQRWILGFGKLKGSALYFFFALFIFFLFALVCNIVSAGFSKDPYFTAFSNNLEFDRIYFVYAFFAAFRFYYTFEEEVLKYDKLKHQGLTLEDVTNIEFVKSWSVIRQIGVIKYCFYNGGLITGMILFFPVSIIYLFFTGDNHGDSIARRFPEFSDMINFILSCILVSYVLGVLVYRIRWTLNERRFIRLNDPLSTIQFDTK